MPTGSLGRARPGVCDGAAQTARKHASSSTPPICFFDRKRVVYESLEERFNRFAALPLRIATEQFHATGTFNDGSTQDLTKSVTWSTSKTAVAFADGRQRATVWWRFVWIGIDRARKALV